MSADSDPVAPAAVPATKERALANALVATLSGHPICPEPDETSQPRKPRSEGSRLASILAAAAALRLALLAFASDFMLRYVSSRVELSTPVASYRRLVEGLFLASKDLSPYDGGLYHQSPLLLMLFKLPTMRPWIPQLCSDVVFVAADILVAFMLAKILALRVARGRRTVSGEPLLSCAPSTVAMLYLFNPLTLATSLARSPIVFSHLAIVSALYFAFAGATDYALVLVAVATHLSVYPLMLIAPVALMACSQQQQQQQQHTGTGKSSCRPGNAPATIALTLVKFALAWTTLHLLFTAIYGGGYFAATFDFTLRVSDLQPNVGLFWYFFIEIFDEFRPFFTVVFQLTALAFAVPVAWRFRNDSLFAGTLLVGTMAALKAYPSWGDLSLFLGLIPIFDELLKYLQYTVLSTSLLFFGICLAPVFWHVWIEQGSGNANFFYAATLVYVFGQISLLFDLGSAMLRRQLDLQCPESRTRVVIQE
ncbi:hypothetical protein GGI07_001118 [Coemansia sp. Benny D115]|nr:hypothetical protein GGI07_001118 [Coemansia sp. Benny D115]